MTDSWRRMLDSAVPALGLGAGHILGVRTTGRGFHRSVHPVSDLATASVAAVAATLLDLMTELGVADDDDAVVDRALADAWFGSHAVPVGWVPPSAWDPLSGAFRARDTWVRLHANAPLHRAALLDVLGCREDADAVGRAVSAWDAVPLEAAIIERGGAAAALRAPGEWAVHPAGRAVAAEPLVAGRDTGPSRARSAWSPTPRHPLEGIRVLDLTRVLAGPTATQVLAGLGADVLRIDPPAWDEPAVLPMVMWGKRSARVDGTRADGAAILRELLASADVVVHGYRAGAMGHLGLDAGERERIRPGLVDVSERAYGFTGPWRGRRGFDSLVQFATGLAHPGVDGADIPQSLPVQALDFATGYLAAASAIAGLTRRVRTGLGSVWELSLARTALALRDGSAPGAEGDGRAPDVPRVRTATAYGDIALAASPFVVAGAGLEYSSLAAPLGGDVAAWRRAAAS